MLEGLARLMRSGRPTTFSVAMAVSFSPMADGEDDEETGNGKRGNGFGGLDSLLIG